MGVCARQFPTNTPLPVRLLSLFMGKRRRQRSTETGGSASLLACFAHLSKKVFFFRHLSEFADHL